MPSFSPLSPNLALFTMSMVGDGADGAATGGGGVEVGGAEAGVAAGVPISGFVAVTGGATGGSESRPELGAADGGAAPCAGEADSGGGVMVSIGAATVEGWASGLRWAAAFCAASCAPTDTGWLTITTTVKAENKDFFI